MTEYLKENKLTLFWDSKISSLIRAMGLVSTFILIKFSSKNLSDEELGYLLAAFSLYSFLSLFDLGLGNASRNLIANEYFSGKKSASFGIYIVLNTILVGVTFLIGIIVFKNVYQEGWLISILNSENILYLLISMICQPGRIGYLSISKTYIAQIIQYLPLIFVTLYSLLFQANFEKLCKFYLLSQSILSCIGFLSIIRHIRIETYIKKWRKKIAIQILNKALSYLIIQSLATATFIVLNIWIIDSVSVAEGLSFNLMFRIYSAGLAIYGAYILPNWTRVHMSDNGINELLRNYLESEKYIVILFTLGGLIVGLFGNNILGFMIEDFKRVSWLAWMMIYAYFLLQLLVQAFGIILNGLGMTRVQVIFGLIQLSVLAIIFFWMEGVNLTHALLVLIIFSLVPLMGSVIHLYHNYVRDRNTYV